MSLIVKCHFDSDYYYYKSLQLLAKVFARAGCGRTTPALVAVRFCPNAPPSSRQIQVHEAAQPSFQARASASTLANRRWNRGPLRGVSVSPIRPVQSPPTPLPAPLRSLSAWLGGGQFGCAIPHRLANGPRTGVRKISPRAHRAYVFLLSTIVLHAQA